MLWLPGESWRKCPYLVDTRGAVICGVYLAAGDVGYGL